MSILLAAGQHSPGHASQLVGDRDHDFIARSTLSQPMHPLPESGVVLDAKQYRTRTVDQHAAQIHVAALADAVEFLLAPVENCRGTTPTQAASMKSFLFDLR
jgi:hypothetical protein